MISIVCPKCGKSVSVDEACEHCFCMYCGFKICIQPVEPEDSVEEYKAKAESGDREAQYKLATLYRTGQGVELSYTEAMKWYLAAAEQGDPFAMYNISLFYSCGYGVKQNCAIAAKWLKDAMDHGFNEAVRKNKKE